MKEPFGIGLAAGTAGVIAINIAEYFLDRLGISETKLWEAGGIFFLSEEAVKTPLGTIIGVITHVFVGLLVAIIISYFLYYSGTDLAVMKGITISLVALLLTLGIVFPLRELAPEMQDNPSDVLSAFIDHIIFGAVAGHIVWYFQGKNEGRKPTKV